MIRISGWQECHDSILASLKAPDPFFLGRIGGSDTDAVAAWLAQPTSDPALGSAAALAQLVTVKKFNGYYDKANSEEKFFRFLSLLRDCYLKTKYLSIVGPKMMTLFFPDCLNPAFLRKHIQNETGFHRLVGMMTHAQSGDWTAYPYTFFENLNAPVNIFRVFEKMLPGKKVLVASPFGESIHANWPNRAKFFKNFDFPEFDVDTLPTPITYDGLPEEFYPHADWFSTLDDLIASLSGRDFDILLLSCGSYAMPLGLHASSVMGRKAIYVGGLLQLFFGIMGRRYDNSFFLNALNRDIFIAPVEANKFRSQIEAHGSGPKEAFGAYF